MVVGVLINLRSRVQNLEGDEFFFGEKRRLVVELVDHRLHVRKVSVEPGRTGVGIVRWLHFDHLAGGVGPDEARS